MIEKQEPVVKIIIPPEKRVEILSKLNIKMGYYKIFELLNDSAVSTFVTKNVSNQMIYQVVNILSKKCKV